MACFSGELRSLAVRLDMRVNVILPQDDERFHENEPVKVLYLLHGYKNSGGAWQRYTGLERFIPNRNVAVILPEMHNSFYMDLPYGGDYFTYLTEELPAYCQKMFHISAKREDTFVMGMSMGGYGALKCALRRPDLYAGVAAFSSAADVHLLAMKEKGKDILKEATAIFGVERQIKPEDDLFLLAKETAKLPMDQKPKIYQTCGTKDFLHETNLRLSRLLSSLPYEYEYEEWEGGHQWKFWEESLYKALNRFLPKNPL